MRINDKRFHTGVNDIFLTIICALPFKISVVRYSLLYQVVVKCI